MPEGDTIHRTALALEKAIGGRSVLAFRSPLARLRGESLAGRKIERVEARGKNLLIHFDDGRVLHTHMRMLGSWHLYRPGERWQKPERMARAVVETADFVAVCFNAPVVRLLSARAALREPALASIGPDLLSEDADLTDARRRLRERPDAAIAEALLAQSAVAGIGNIYKSETLFLCGISPFRTVGELSDGELDRLLERARDLMSESLRASPNAGRRFSRFSAGGRFWVYRRAGLPCRKCGDRLRRKRQGAHARSTYWCPTCQVERGRPTS